MAHSFYSNIDGFHISYADEVILQSMTSTHYHNAYEFFLVMDGVRHVFFDNAMNELKCGSLVILKPFVPHYTETPETKSFKRFLLNVTEEYYDDVLNKKEQCDFFKNIRTGVYNLNDEDYQRVLDGYKDMYAALALKHTDSKMKLFKMHTACFIQNIGIITKKYPTCREPEKMKNTDLSHAIEYINQNYAENISLEFIASYAHMSQSNFCLMFKKETGNTFLHYLQALRGAKAHKLLGDKKMSVGEIADKTGFSNVRQMDRVFRRLYGKTPSEMREIND